MTDNNGYAKKHLKEKLKLVLIQKYLKFCVVAEKSKSTQICDENKERFKIIKNISAIFCLKSRFSSLQIYASQECRLKLMKLIFLYFQTYAFWLLHTATGAVYFIWKHQSYMTVAPLVAFGDTSMFSIAKSITSLTTTHCG